MPVFFLPQSKSCCICVKNLKRAAIFISLFGLVEGLVTVIVFIEACNTLYTASGRLGIAMLVWIGCTTTLGIFLMIGSVCFLLQIFLKLQCADNLFIWLLLLVPFFNIVYFILTILRVTVDKVQCMPFVYDNKVKQVSALKFTGSAYVMFLTLAIAGLSIYFAFIINAYSCDLEYRRRSTLNCEAPLNFLPECLKSHLCKMKGKMHNILQKPHSTQHNQQFTLNIVSTENHVNLTQSDNNRKKSLSATANERYSNSSISNRTLRFQDDTSDSSFEYDKYYERDDYNKHDDRNKHDNHSNHDGHSKD